MASEIGFETCPTCGGTDDETIQHCGLCGGSSKVTLERGEAFRLDIVAGLRAQSEIGLETCPACGALSPGMNADGETIRHCDLCHDSGKVTLKEAKAYWVGWNSRERFYQRL